MDVQKKKLEILDYVFNSKDGCSWNELSEFLNELSYVTKKDSFLMADATLRRMEKTIETIHPVITSHFDSHKSKNQQLFTTSEKSFKAGVEFAQRWISVGEDTPIALETGDWDGKRSDFVLGKSNKGVHHIVRVYKGFMDGSQFCEFCDKDDTVINIVEWRPIDRV